MWVDNDVPTLKNFYWSPFSKWDNVEFVQYCGGHFENGDQ
jgi:hypothetical protein